MATMKRIGKCATSVIGTLSSGLLVKYHDTIVVTAQNGVVRLDSGGWRTPTTKTRMNQASNEYGLGFQVYQKDGNWYVHSHGIDTPFHDGMRIGENGHIITAG